MLGLCSRKMHHPCIHAIYITKHYDMSPFLYTIAYLATIKPLQRSTDAQLSETCSCNQSIWGWFMFVIVTKAYHSIVKKSQQKPCKSVYYSVVAG